MSRRFAVNGSTIEHMGMKNETRYPLYSVKWCHFKKKATPELQIYQISKHKQDCCPCDLSHCRSGLRQWERSTSLAPINSTEGISSWRCWSFFTFIALRVRTSWRINNMGKLANSVSVCLLPTSSLVLFSCAWLCDFWTSVSRWANSVKVVT